MDNSSTPDLSLQLESALHSLQRARLKHKSEHGPKQAEAFLLLMLFCHSQDAKVTPSKAAELLGVSQAAISNKIQSLESQGLIERSQNPEDGRGVYFALTLQGGLVLTELKQFHSAKMREITQMLGESDSAELVRLLNKISDYLHHYA